ncbi:hypothetical protein OJAV_G00136650 [Oryzias javanicus]|uniref:Uncharacterized protein n=1 Tax=Oryzias javanicus TaxID=123683 RepID=A0A437CN23_ORYJA|nr:hypothetical protein OJAV_G00136650 [Oryzias javanicus]
MWMKGFLTENQQQPTSSDPGSAKSRARLEDRLYEHLEWSSTPTAGSRTAGGVRAGLEVGSTTPHGFGPGTALMRCGETQKQLGETERKFVQSTNIHFLPPLRSFTEGGYRAIQTSSRGLGAWGSASCCFP